MTIIWFDKFIRVLISGSTFNTYVSEWVSHWVSVNNIALFQFYKDRPTDFMGYLILSTTNPYNDVSFLTFYLLWRTGSYLKY